MSEPYLSQIEAFAFGFVPKGWMQCAGQTLPINQYQALFALLGTTYGGNGIQTFNLPDLRGRLALGYGTGPGLSTYILGETTGQENVTLLSTNLPLHNHTVNANTATTGTTNEPAPTNVLAPGATTNPTAALNIYSTGNPTVPMGALGPAGGQTPHGNLMPYLPMTYCICISGLFPSRG